MMIWNKKMPVRPPGPVRRGESPTMLTLLVLLTGVASGAAPQLEAHTLQAFEQYTARTEQRVLDQARSNGSFLYLDWLPEAPRNEIFADLRRGEMYMRIEEWSKAAVDFRQAIDLLEERARQSTYRDLWVALARAHVKAVLLAGIIIFSGATADGLRKRFDELRDS